MAAVAVPDQSASAQAVDQWRKGGKAGGHISEETVPYCTLLQCAKKEICIWIGAAMEVGLNMMEAPKFRVGCRSHVLSYHLAVEGSQGAKPT